MSKNGVTIVVVAAALTACSTVKGNLDKSGARSV